jgi:hypothetical protein
MIVIPLAGRSSRFKFSGVLDPKWSISLGSETVLMKAFKSVRDSLQINEKFAFGVPKEFEKLFWNSFIGIDRSQIDVVFLNQTTNGQSETVERILRNINLNQSERLVIWCGDSAFDSSSVKFQNWNCNWLLVSNLPGTHWSFVKEDNHKVTQVAEKKRISNLASVGLYGFESIKKFMSLEPSRIRFGYEESFVAPLYNTLIERGETVRCFTLNPIKFYPLGTPVEMVLTCKRMGWNYPQYLSN